MNSRDDAYLDLSGTFDGQFIFLGQFVHTQDSDDILEAQ
jgi:hypothetical protein